MKVLFYIVTMITTCLIGFSYASESKVSIPKYQYNVYEHKLEIRSAQQGPISEVVLEKFAEKYISETENTVVYFKMNNCQFCKKYDPIYDKVSKLYANKAKFYIINIDEGDNRLYAKALEIPKVPTTILFPKSKTGIAFLGYAPEDAFINFLDNNLK